MDLQHPMVTKINKSGYLKEMSGLENVVCQPEHAGISFYGTEILEGETIAIDHDNFHELILRDELKQYCIEHLHFRFERGWVIDKSEMFRERWLEDWLREEYNFEFRVAD